MVIYVLPTEQGRPPQAIIGLANETDEATEIVGTIATWSPDLGCWTLNDAPLPPELGEAITDHAKSLGVEW